MPGRWTRRRLLAVAAVVLLLAVGAAAAVIILHSPGNVSHPGVEFTAPSSATATAPPPPPKKHKAVNTFLWPRYGYDAARTRLFNPGRRLDPPLRIGWRYQDYALLEFPPVIDGNTLYLDDDDASAKAIDLRNGHKLWEHKLGTLAAASPAIGARQGLIYVPILSIAGHSPGGGAIFALSMKTGRVAWKHLIAAGTESSPLAYGNSVYLGDQSGTVYSMDARTGHVNWTYHASSAVKGGPAIADGIVYFGDYAGRAYALDARTGHQVWAVSTSGAQFGFGSGNFYATPAVAFGRVYLGNTDGRVYSFGERNGTLAWATATGAYVYASPAVADIPGVGPTVYEGSYDGNFYAFDARSGAIRWRHRAGGKISGSATILGGIVYLSVLGSKTTIGLDARTGKRVFFFGDGAFNPIVADNSTVYLTGYTKLYEMIPRRG
jgi:outer membrane protein assembly factor BamB